MSGRALASRFLLFAVASILTARQAAPQGFISTVAVTGQQAAGLPAGVLYGDNFLYSQTYDLNSSGQVSFSAGLMGPGVTDSNNQAIWMGKPGALNLVVRAGDPAPGTAPGVVFRGGNSLRYALGDDGQVFFSGYLSGPGVDATNNGAIWRGRPGDLHLIVRSGDPAPGTPSGVTFNALSHWGGRIFQAILTGPGVSSENDIGYWLAGDNGLTLIAREGDQAPGAPAGVKFAPTNYSTFFSDVDDSGRTAFLMGLSGTGVTPDNDHGIWFTDPGGTSRVVRRGDPAPGTGPGVFYRLVGTLSSETPRPVLRGDQIAFQSNLDGPGITTLNNNSIWAGPPDNLTLRVRDGQMAPGTNLPFRRVSWPQLNDAGDIAFASYLDSPNLDDESGIWLATGGGMRLIARQGQVAPESNGWFYTDMVGGDPTVGLNSLGQVAYRAGLNPNSGYNETSLNGGIWIDDGGQQFRVAGTGDTLAGRTVQSAFFSPPVHFNDLGQLFFETRFDSTSLGLFLYSDVVPEPSPLLRPA